MTYLDIHSLSSVLIVDDHLDNLRVLHSLFDEVGIRVRSARNGKLALTSAQSEVPDLILLDIKMPVMDGYEVCRHLKANKITCDVPVIFLSAFDEVFDKVKAFEVGGVDYITKPFQIQEVLIRISHQLELARAKREIQRLNADLEQTVQQRTALLHQEIAERKQVESKLSESEKRLDSILDSLEEAVWSIKFPIPLPDPFRAFETGIFYINQAAKTVLGQPIEKFLKTVRLWLEITHPEDQLFVEQSFSNLINESCLSLQYRIIRPNGYIAWINDRRQLIYNDLGEVIRLDGVISDITSQKEIEERLRYDALHDDLTGLSNRTLLIERIEQALKRSKRKLDQAFAVLFIDLDQFKLINDTLGHAFGDQLLIKIAKLLKDFFRDTDTVARLGGDEFAILLEDIQDVVDVHVLVERLIEKLEIPIKLEAHTTFMSASIGIALSSKEYQEADSLLRDADIAMYQAKSLGKGRHILFDTKMYKQSLSLLQMQAELRHALEHQEFVLYYQPIVCLQTGQIKSVEALIRWKHPVRGLVSPIEFIPVAEDTGLIIPIGEWVLQEVCKQMRSWQAQFSEALPFSISINIASKQFQEHNFIDVLDRILISTGINPVYLQLEITESMLMKQDSKMLNKMSQLRSRKISLSIDDFGTGYSSLAYLRNFPINRLKVDRSFISQMHVSSETFEIVRTIITLAHTLGMDVVAEGLETSEQKVLLQSLGCELAQGYLFDKPLDAQTLTAKLATCVQDIS